MIKSVLVGGPLLGDRSIASTREKAITQIPNDIKSWSTFEPIVTPSISNEQFILLPGGHFVTVLAYNTGRRVASFIPLMDNEQLKNGVMIESACLALFPTSPEKAQTVTDALRKLGDDTDGSENDEKGDCHVLLVGCSDGTIREFDLSVLTRQQKGGETSMSCGDYEIPGLCYRPRRVLSVTDKHAIKHLTAPPDVVLKNGDIPLYCLFEVNADGKSQPARVNSFLLRVQLPRFQEEHGKGKVIVLHGKEYSDRTIIQDSIKGLVGYDKNQVYHNTVPFRLSSVSRRASRTFAKQDDQADRDVVMVLAQSTKLHVYHDPIKSGEASGKMRSTTFAAAPNNLLTSVSVAPNGTDISCGYMEGDIRVMTDALPQILDYFQKLSEGKKGMPHPSTTVLIRRVHWHAHPVTSLAYQSACGSVDPMLYSGGFESVLVTWQLSRGNYRPADVLPRLAKGGILHICCSSQDGGTGGILVYCEDNSLQLFATHNKSRLWKVQGLASSTGDSLGASNARVRPMIRADSPSLGANTLILSGLRGAPGYLHWYDIREQRVTAQLEVAPFNRVSRTEPDDSPMPVPSVTNCAFSESGRDLVTVDTTPTENGCIGAPEWLPNGIVIGVVSTVRFWTLNPLDKKRNKGGWPYSLTAAMTYPHGEGNRVTAIAISRDGQYACTVSNDENAFRLWHRVLSEDTDSDDRDVDKKSRRTPVWLCRFKVTTPSGYSNFGTGGNAVDFSSDGSILAICYGNMLTLWDHNEATLLTALQHLEDDRAPVETLSFVKTNFVHDLILTKSRSGVALQSPYQSGKGNWFCALPEEYKDASVAHAELIPSHDLITVCISFHNNKAQSRVLLLDAVTGVPRTSSGKDGETKPIIWELPGTIQSVGVQGKPTKLSNWVEVSSLQEGKPEKETSPIRLYVTMSNGDMMLLTSDESAFSAVDTNDTLNSSLYQPNGTSTDAPRLNMLKRGDDRKRKRKDASLEMNVLPKKRINVSIGTLFGDDGTESAPLPSSDLPALGGAFTRAFVSRNLASNRGDTFGEE